MNNIIKTTPLKLDTRERILETAERLFAERGFEAGGSQSRCRQLPLRYQGRAGQGIVEQAYRAHECEPPGLIGKISFSKLIWGGPAGTSLRSIFAAFFQYRRSGGRFGWTLPAHVGPYLIGKTRFYGRCLPGAF